MSNTHSIVGDGTGHGVIWPGFNIVFIISQEPILDGNTGKVMGVGIIGSMGCLKEGVD